MSDPQTDVKQALSLLEDFAHKHFKSAEGGMAILCARVIKELQEASDNWQRQARTMAKAADNEKACVTELQAELGRLRDEKMALIAVVNGCKDGARQGFMEFKAEVDAAEEKAEQYRGLLQLLVDWDKQWPTSRTYNIEQFNRLENKLTEIIEKIKTAFKEHPTQEPTNGS